MTDALQATGPFLDLGFTKVELKRKENGHLEFDISGRRRGVVDQWLQGEIDPVGLGVIIGTIDLVPRTLNKYGGLEEVGPGKHQIPENVARDQWNKVVGNGQRRWKGVVGATPGDKSQPPTLAKAERQNELIHALVLLANQALGLGIGPAKPLRYVAHQHVSSPDGGVMMAYGRADRGWATQDTTYVVTAQPTEPIYALLGTTNASFVQFLIEQSGARLGISRLESITVDRMGLDVRWTFA